jgi:hypothetical protein
MSALPKLPWQEPSQICVTEDSVEALYEKEKIRRELDGEKGFDTAIRLLGNPFVEGFEDSNIISLQVPVLVPTRACRSRWMSTASLRPCSSRRSRSSSEYADLREKPGFEGSWNVLCAERDLKNQAFHQVVAYKNEMRAKRRMLSFHAFGSAIDINADWNDFNPEARFDMPKRIVRLFESLGFAWGGYYHDYMHFEYMRSSIVGVSDEARRWCTTRSARLRNASRR